MDESSDRELRHKIREAVLRGEIRVEGAAAPCARCKIVVETPKRAPDGNAYCFLCCPRIYASTHPTFTATVRT